MKILGYFFCRHWNGYALLIVKSIKPFVGGWGYPARENNNWNVVCLTEEQTILYICRHTPNDGRKKGGVLTDRPSAGLSARRIYLLRAHRFIARPDLCIIFVYCCTTPITTVGYYYTLFIHVTANVGAASDKEKHA